MSMQVEFEVLDDTDASLGIAEVARLSGLSQDTLRWYEREGLLPAVRRGSDRRRRYTRRDAALVETLAKLRESGMPTDEMREFSRLVAGGAATHARRLAILEAHRDRIRRRQAELDQHLASLEEKVTHYRYLIDAGLDCDGRPVSGGVASVQRSVTTNGSLR
ncbi:MerR family transcriptional regulator [Galbitalea sp. SE-J8]|uniref:MerR family transcriptional regulator n=1 Tax=Galbitalea sp. SE-J8 TaxID=3054952 RepID=UPI00259C92DA|nr:MerR family transcriptional regulator [Galbitalea sp. SE-J8]MDM4763218.1 MerR family transcriptional regulator [Galbitalea sp. SE-J8]